MKRVEKVQFKKNLVLESRRGRGFFLKPVREGVPAG